MTIYWEFNYAVVLHTDVLRLVNTWDKTNPNTAWIVKRGIRSLLKEGEKSSMNIFGLTKDVNVTIRKFRMSSDVLRLNDVLQFQFDVVSGKAKSQKLMIDYRIHYYKKRGNHSEKVFKLKEIVLGAGKTISITRKQRFQDFTTRKLHSGQHILEIVVNGKIVKRRSFEFVR